jgi:hypothetical protein
MDISNLAQQAYDLVGPVHGLAAISTRAPAEPPQRHAVAAA